jgi:regulator of replication initiation timing
VEADTLGDLADKTVRQATEIRELNARVAELIEQVTELEYDNTGLRARQAAHVCATPEAWVTTIPRPH